MAFSAKLVNHRLTISIKGMDLLLGSSSNTLSSDFSVPVVIIAQCSAQIAGIHIVDTAVAGIVV